MLERQRLRREGLLNKPIAGLRGLQNIVARMAGYAPHRLLCQCLECIPMALRPQFAPIPDGMEPESERPVVKIKGKKGFPKPRKK